MDHINSPSFLDDIAMTSKWRPGQSRPGKPKLKANLTLEFSKNPFSEDSRKLISSKHRVYVLFRSLSRHQHTGFHLEYKAICGGEIKLTKNQASKNQAYEIMSPNFPEEYPSNSNCSWIVTAPPGFAFTITSKVSPEVKPEINRKVEYCWIHIRISSGLSFRSIWNRKAWFLPVSTIYYNES